MRDTHHRWAIVVACMAGFVGSAGCTDEDDEQQSSTTLTARYSGDFGFAFDASSTERLASLLRPGETVLVSVDGNNVPLRSVDWSAMSNADGGHVALQASDGRATRSLGTLELTTAFEPPRCDSAADHANPSPLSLASGADDEPDVSPFGITPAGCTNWTYEWFCINCQCRVGIAIKGMSQRHICIYGTWYPEQICACNCPFTNRTCGEV